MNSSQANEITLTGNARWVRYVTFTALYIAQGIPIGLLDVAMPAWLAEQGYSNGQVAGFVGVVSLPWAFKLIAGPFMDRFRFPPMGLRRPWVMAAQTGLMLALIGMATIPDPVAQLGVLTAIGFAVNTFAATQDVAVDGMAIHVAPENERGTLNAFMGFGQVVGFALFGALSATLLKAYGLEVAALACAGGVSLILVLITFVRERVEDVYLPGQHPLVSSEEGPQVTSFSSLSRDLFRVLTLPMSLIILASIMIERTAAGMIVVVSPLFAVNQLGFEAAQYSQMYSAAAGAVALLGLAIGPVVDRLGGKRVIISGMIFAGVVLLIMAAGESAWSSLWFVVPLFLCYMVAMQAVFIGIIAQCMNICWVATAATQFAVYMALANLGRSFGAGLYGLISADVSYREVFLIVAAGMFLASIVLRFFNQEAQTRRLASL
jgi:PAT family beta-lactamase induction signal transducer AmpG